MQDFTKIAIKVMVSPTLDATIVLKAYLATLIKVLIVWIGLDFILGIDMN